MTELLAKIFNGVLLMYILYDVYKRHVIVSSLSIEWPKVSESIEKLFKKKRDFYVY